MTKPFFKSASLTPQAFAVLNNKATEPPHSGQFNLNEQQGSYLCRQCGLALFRSSNKFLSGCGWPSFDDEIPNAIKREVDADGHRTEILCNRCSGHLGHVFTGEMLTPHNQRHCVNSLALDFVENSEVLDTHEVIFAAGCFWGVQTLLEQNKGVVYSEVGYCGGTEINPTYEQVCSGRTGHLEAIRILFDPKLIDYEALTKDFFCIHNPTQQNGQGPDIGPQYLSAVFYHNEEQKQIVENLIAQLEKQNLQIATDVRFANNPFWPAEEYHQNYYAKTGKTPYCHIREPRFE
tara:strand:+ start:20170 stop:21042 length:873 start_codon:yes stop_codon:yes gene_type:complete